MIHIILAILKIVGILLAVLLGLVLLILLTVLFLPLRYRICAEKHGELKKSTANLNVDFEKLFYNMLDAKAKWLYTLPEWADILCTADFRKKDRFR